VGRGPKGEGRRFNAEAQRAQPLGELLHVGSLSKALGVPVAFVAGPAEFIEYLRPTAGASAHSSPPAIPTVAAALAALEVHAAHGAALRLRLAARVRQFRAGLRAAGLPLQTAGLFPIQSLGLSTPQAVLAAGRALRWRGVWPVVQLHAPERPRGGVLRFIQDDIGGAVAAIVRVFSTRSV
jgi:8-amino-7-oxononanoate synthase